MTPLNTILTIISIAAVIGSILLENNRKETVLELDMTFLHRDCTDLNPQKAFDKLNEFCKQNHMTADEKET